MLALRDRTMQAFKPIIYHKAKQVKSYLTQKDVQKDSRKLVIAPKSSEWLDEESEVALQTAFDQDRETCRSRAKAYSDLLVTLGFRKKVKSQQEEKLPLQN